jgi:phthiocerol/phenolphthiocerol synthesis type-I polyketide synthase E
LTGDWITPADATDPSYWARHLRHTVRFDAGLRRLLEEPDWVLLEVGPGRSLSHLARQHPSRAPGQVVLASCRHAAEERGDLDTWLRSVGELWVAGGPVRRGTQYEGEHRRRLPLPTYPFERRRHWADLPDRARPEAPAAPSQAEPVVPSQAAPSQTTTSQVQAPVNGLPGPTESRLASIMSQQVELMMEQLRLLEDE